jgi:hypothetical protein
LLWRNFEACQVWRNAHAPATGIRGTRRGREAAALNAASAALGSVAMIGFAATFLAALFYGAAAAVGSASIAWILVAISAWHLRCALKRSQ